MIYGVFSTGIPSRKFFTFTSTNAINSKMQFLLIDIDSGSTMCRTISVIRYFANLEVGSTVDIVDLLEDFSNASTFRGRFQMFCTVFGDIFGPGTFVIAE